jgi:hypothetical protein
MCHTPVAVRFCALRHCIVGAEHKELAVVIIGYSALLNLIVFHIKIVCFGL